MPKRTTTPRIPHHNDFLLDAKARPVNRVMLVAQPSSQPCCTDCNAHHFRAPVPAPRHGQFIAQPQVCALCQMVAHGTAIHRRVVGACASIESGSSEARAAEAHYLRSGAWLSYVKAKHQRRYHDRTLSRPVSSRNDSA